MSPLPLIPRTCLKIRLLWHNGHVNSHFSISCPCWRNWTLTSRLLWDNLMCIAAWLLLYLCFIAFFFAFFPWTNSYLVIIFKKLQFECFHLHIYLNLNAIHHFQLFPRHTIKKTFSYKVLKFNQQREIVDDSMQSLPQQLLVFRSVQFSSVQNLFSTLEIWTIFFYTHLM